MKRQSQQPQQLAAERTESIAALESLSPELAAKLNERVAEMRSEFMSYREIAEAVGNEFKVSVGLSTLWYRLHNDAALAKAVADKVAIKNADVLGTVKLSHKSERVKFYERLAIGAEKKGRFLQAAQIAFLIGKELGQIQERMEITGNFESFIGEKPSAPLHFPVIPSSEATRVN